MKGFVHENNSLGFKRNKVHDIAGLFESLKIFKVNFVGRKFFIRFE